MPKIKISNIQRNVTMPSGKFNKLPPLLYSPTHTNNTNNLIYNFFTVFFPNKSFAHPSKTYFIPHPLRERKVLQKQVLLNFRALTPNPP